MKRNILLLITFFLLFVTVQAQDFVQAYHSVSLKFGINQIKDENLHSKVSTGTITDLGYGFEKRKKDFLQFRFSIGYSRLKTKIEDISKSANIRLLMSYSHGFRLVNKTKFHFFLGPELQLGYNVCYFPNWDDSHLYWASHYSIGASAAFIVPVKNYNQWFSSLSFPLFSVFSRPELYRLYKIDDTDFGGILGNQNRNLTAAHLVNVFYVRFQTEYRFPVFSKKKQALFYAFDYLRVKSNRGNPFSQINHQLGIKFLL